jgi:hypothetical protein
MLECVGNELPELNPLSLRRRAAVAQLLMSPYAWEVMRQFGGFDGIEAAEAAVEALLILLGRRIPA